MNASQQTLRKAAILIDSLDPQSADALLEQMPGEQAARVRSMVMHLGNVPAAERERVIEEFMRGDSPQRSVRDDGVELDDSLAEKLKRRPMVPASISDDGDAPAETQPFRFLHEAAVETLASFLRHEHPQTIAVIASHLPAERAAGLLARLGGSLQAEVVRRIAELDDADPEVIREVEAQIEFLLSEQLHTHQRRSAGLAAVRAILEAADFDDRQELLSRIQQHDRELASRLAPPENPVGSKAERVPPARPSTESRAEADAPSPTPATLPMNPPRAPEAANSPRSPEVVLDFADLSRFDDQSLAVVFQAADPQVSLLALTGASSDLVERIVSRLPAREGKSLLRRIEQSGPVRLRDLDAAQTQMARLAARLAAQGRIRWPLSRRTAMAA